MTFSDRIVFLMELTSTTNKQLADAAKVDPSLISLIRTGRREPSKNNTYVRALSDFFSAKCTENYQRIALSEAIGNKNLQPGMDKKQLSSIIFDWLTDNRDSVGTLMSTFERSVLEEYPAQTPLGPVEAPPKVTSNCFSFFGNEGKRSAINTFINHLSRLSEPGTILLYTDESSEYLFEEPVYLPKLEGKIMHLLRNGFKIRRITGLISSADQAFFSLTRWLPLYMTGHVESFYYPRLRDNLLRRTLIVMPNVGAVISNSTEGQKNSRTTVYVLDRHMANSYAGEFEDMLSKCRPMMTTYSRAENLNEILRCFSQFESDQGSRIQQSSSLSSITLPISLMPIAAGRSDKDETEAIVASLSESADKFRQCLAEYPVIDIHHIAQVEDIKAGKIPISTAFMLNNDVVCYTPETYVEHLQSILRYMKKYPNYSAVLLPYAEDTHALMVKDKRRALMLRPEPSLIVFEVSQPNIADACNEYLLRLAEDSLSVDNYRQVTIEHLESLIHQLRLEV